MAKKVLITLAEGFEEIEAITVIDVLRRAELDVVVAGVGRGEITGAHGVKVIADTTLEEVSEVPDVIVLPGGMPGTDNLKNSKALSEMLQKVKEQDKMIASICAAPARILSPAGLLDGKKATCYPGFEKEFKPEVSFSEERVVKDGNVITSRGPGSALEFSLEIVSNLVSPEKASILASQLVVKT